MNVKDPLLRALKEHFQLDSFRPGQREVIESTLAGRPTLAVMPTGSGKSLCYQLPAMLLPGLTVVVSPLVALMKDQVDSLVRQGIFATCLHSAQSEGERLAAETALGSGRLRLLYLAPERLRNPKLRALLLGQVIDLLAIDEAHCISEWGHAFRPDYEKLGQFVEDFSPRRMVALTATATREVQDDIIRSLKMVRPVVWVAGFDRPNLFLEIHRLDSDAEKRDTLKNALGKALPAIIYTSTRRRCESYARTLAQQGFLAEPYHAGMSARRREQVQDRFLAGKLQAVVATNAFGLGIDKANIRLVAHIDLPRSLAAYYQEIGRAGRDGHPSLALMLFSGSDVWKQKHLIELANPRPRAVWELIQLLKQTDQPCDAEELAQSISLDSSQMTSALSFLESINLVEKAYSPAKLAISLNPKSQAHAQDDPRVTALLRELGAPSGELSMSVARLALKAPSQEKMQTEIAQLESEGLLLAQQLYPRQTYRLGERKEISREALESLRKRSRRDRNNLHQMVLFANRRSCRRQGLLQALGEMAVKPRCVACDVCVGPNIRPVRSRLRKKLQSEETTHSGVSRETDMGDP